MTGIASIVCFGVGFIVQVSIGRKTHECVCYFEFEEVTFDGVASRATSLLTPEC